jgi:hypothetical protein
MIRTSHKLLIRGDEYLLKNNPLYPYIELRGIDNDVFNGLRGGYWSRWEVQDGQLLFTQLIGEWEALHNRVEISVEKLFPNSGCRVFADWFSGQLECQCSNDKNEELQNHGGRVLLIEVDRGVVKYERIESQPIVTEKDIDEMDIPAFLR